MAASKKATKYSMKNLIGKSIICVDKKGDPTGVEATLLAVEPGWIICDVSGKGILYLNLSTNDIGGLIMVEETPND